MLSKKAFAPMNDTELQAWDSSHDFEAELIESVGQMADGKTSLAYSPVIIARKASGFSTHGYFDPPRF